MRLKYFILSCLAFLVSLAVVSCGEDKTPIIDNSWNNGTLTVVEEVSLAGTNSQQINIKASAKPSLTCDAEWLKIGEVKRLTTGLYSVELSAEPNVSGETRTAKVTVTEGKETATVTVIQPSSDVVSIVSVDPQGSLDPAGGTLVIRYAATGTPAANLPEWIRPSGSRSLEEGTLPLTYLPNDTGSERVGVIVLAVGKDAVANVTVSQPARKAN